MIVLKRTLAALALLLGAAGLLLSLTAAVGVWVVKGRVTAKATHVFGRVDAALDVAEQGLGQVKTSLARAAERLDGAKEEQRRLAGEPQQAGVLRRMMARTVQQKVAPEVSNAHEKLHTVAEAAVVVNAVLEDVGNFPLLSVTGLDIDRLTEMNSRLAEVGPAAWELSRLLGEPTPDADAGAQMSRVEQTLKTMRRLVEEYEPRVAQARRQAEGLRARTLPWATPAAVAISLAALWVAVSQVSVLAWAWAWWKRAGQPLAAEPQ